MTTLRILTLQYTDGSPSRLIGERIRAGGGEEVVVDAPGGDSAPPGGEGFDGLLVLGGPQHAGDDEGCPWFAGHLELIRRFHAASRPVLGLCLGAQLISRAFGGSVYRHSLTEFGFVPVRVNAAGRSDDLLGGMTATPSLMCWHEDTFDLPAQATLLMTGEACRHQAFRIGESCYGFQPHPEVDAALVREWARLPEAAEVAEDGDAITQTDREMRLHMDAAEQFGRDIADRWLGMVRKRAGLHRESA